MATRKTSPKKSPKAAAKPAATGKKSGSTVETDGRKTIRTDADGGTCEITHASEAAAAEYAKGVK